MFSPYYAAARRLGWGDPDNFCALNVAIYEPRRKFWTMTERTRRDLHRDRDTLCIGPSALTCNGAALHIEVNEWTVPVPRRVRGRIRLMPLATNQIVTHLDPAGRHRWRPIVPHARITVEFDQPGVRWQGNAYLDTNAGDEALETAFRSWDWARIHTPAGSSILYDVVLRDGAAVSVVRTFDAAGIVRAPNLPGLMGLSRTKWRIPRHIRCEPSHAPRVIRTLEDTPFYARSLVETCLGGRTVTAIHESLSLDRVTNPVVRYMLPFRMPRWRQRRA